MQSSTRLALLFLVAAAALGWNLTGYRLLDPDEGRNAEVAREMALANDYLVPHLDGLPYLDKPVAYFAAAAGLMEVFGPSELTARLPAYLATLATMALLVWFARRRWGPAAGWLAGIAYATMPLTLAYAHVAMFDSLLTLCTTAAIVSFFEERTTLAWMAMGAGALAKGPIALAIPLVVVGVESIVSGTPLRRLASLRALAGFGLVTLPWFLAVTLAYPEFPAYAFVRETFQRFTTTAFHRTEPIWYYLPIVPLAAFPWFVPACARLRRSGAAWAARREAATRESLWLACWVLAPLALLTLNQSKLPQYVLPIMPAFALAAARNLTAVGGGARTAWRWYVGTAALLGMLFILVPVRIGSPVSLTPAERASMVQTAFAVGAVLLASAACLALAARLDDLWLAALAYAAVVIAIPFSSGALMRAVGEDRSAAGLAAAIEQLAVPEVLGVSAYPPSLPFYLGRTIGLATATAAELTSNYIVAYQDRYRAVRGTPLRPLREWETQFAVCATPTVFIARRKDHAVRAALAVLPLIAEDSRYAAYGPCPTASPRARRGAPGE